MRAKVLYEDSTNLPCKLVDGKPVGTEDLDKVIVFMDTEKAFPEGIPKGYTPISFASAFESMDETLLRILALLR